MEISFEPYMGNAGIKLAPKSSKYGADIVQPYNHYCVQTWANIWSCLVLVIVLFLTRYMK